MAWFRSKSKKTADTNSAGQTNEVMGELKPFIEALITDVRIIEPSVPLFQLETKERTLLIRFISEAKQEIARIKKGPEEVLTAEESQQAAAQTQQQTPEQGQPAQGDEEKVRLTDGLKKDMMLFIDEMNQKDGINDWISYYLKNINDLNNELIKDINRIIIPVGGNIFPNNLKLTKENIQKSLKSLSSDTQRYILDNVEKFVKESLNQTYKNSLLPELENVRPIMKRIFELSFQHPELYQAVEENLRKKYETEVIQYLAAERFFTQRVADLVKIYL